MERWSGRVALVTGASAGIGAATAKELVKQGMKVVAVARRVDRIEALEKELKGEKGKLYPLKADVKNESDILKTFEWIKKNLGGVDVVINNAGIADNIPLTDFSTNMFRDIFDVNVIGLSICTREGIKSMKERGIDDGHVININSTAGHLPQSFLGVQPYTATKHAVTVLTEGLRRELVQQKSKIRVTSISPGFVYTEMYQKSQEAFPDVDFSQIPALHAKDIADAIVFVLGAPPHVQVHELMVRPVGQEG